MSFYGLTLKLKADCIFFFCIKHLHSNIKPTVARHILNTFLTFTNKKALKVSFYVYIYIYIHIYTDMPGKKTIIYKEGRKRAVTYM